MLLLLPDYEQIAMEALGLRSTDFPDPSIDRHATVAAFIETLAQKAKSTASLEANMQEALKAAESDARVQAEFMPRMAKALTQPTAPWFGGAGPGGSLAASQRAHGRTLSACMACCSADAVTRGPGATSEILLCGPFLVHGEDAISLQNVLSMNHSGWAHVVLAQPCRVWSGSEASPAPWSVAIYTLRISREFCGPCQGIVSCHCSRHAGAGISESLSAWCMKTAFRPVQHASSGSAE